MESDRESERSAESAPVGRGATRIEVAYPDRETWLADWRRLRRLGWTLTSFLRDDEGITAAYRRANWED